MQVEHFTWEITPNCNLQCEHCRVAAGPGVRKDEPYDLDRICGLLQQMVVVGAKAVTFTGGEPLLRSDMPEIVRLAKTAGLVARVQTNGTLLRKHGLLDAVAAARLDELIVGVDGATEESYRKLRGVACLATVLDGVRGVKNNSQIRCQIVFTVTRENVGEFEAMLDLAESLGVDSLLLNVPMFCGRCTSEDERYRFTSAEHRGLLARFVDERRKRTALRLVCLDPLLVLVDEDMRVRIRQVGDPTSGKIRAGCSAGLCVGFIDLQGEVRPCSFLREVSLGNVMRENLVEICDGTRRPLLMRQFIARELHGRCGTCDDRYVCGGCRARALAVHGDALGPDPYCWMSGDRNLDWALQGETGHG